VIRTRRGNGNGVYGNGNGLRERIQNSGNQALDFVIHAPSPIEKIVHSVIECYAILSLFYRSIREVLQ